MELPCRLPQDALLKPGALGALLGRLRGMAQAHGDIRTVIVCAFDRRTRMLPFVYADKRMAPAGVRAVGAAMAAAGFDRTRIVLQQWNANFQPSRALLDGAAPDILMISAMNIHTAPAKALIRDACRIPPAHRPLVIAGGPKAIYEPWDLFSCDPSDRWGADVAVTGEEYVLLELLERLLGERRRGEPVRQAFIRGRDKGLFDSVAGLVWRRDADGASPELVDTGVQRLLSDLDELPHPAGAYSMLEPPGRGAGLSSRALPAARVRRYSPLGSLVLTFGCAFSCEYCPIPAYNQRHRRAKSGARVLDEMTRLYREYGIRYFFGTDDNFFNDRDRALEVTDALARAQVGTRALRHTIRWGTEVTVHDTLGMAEHMGTVRKAGVRALWLGVEDMSGVLVRKGQTADRTIEAFKLLTSHGICPMPMMMHHDDQPLVSRKDCRGLINQVRMLRGAGAFGLQILMLTPAAGSSSYERTYESGAAIDSAAGRPVKPHMLDGNYVTASRTDMPWKKQAGMLSAYLYFYNPLRLVAALLRVRRPMYAADVLMQVLGMWGLVKTLRRTLPWLLRLWRGPLSRAKTAPTARVNMVTPWPPHAAQSRPPAPPAHPQRTSRTRTR